MGKPSAHSLTMTSRVLHHMICSILLPRGGHLDEVSYLEAFIVDSILTGRRIHSSTRVLPYGRFLTRAFKDVGIDLSRETDIEAPTTYDTIEGLMLTFRYHITEGIHCEATFSEPMMIESSFTADPSSQPSFTELPSRAPHATDYPPWMDLSA
ncbi:hypothetical protein AAG906_022423 [Vitis piasezkii]